MNYRGCTHLQSYVTEKNLLEYARLYSSLIACNSEQALKVKATKCVCFKCCSHVWRLHACLFCMFIGCYDDKHIHEHVHETNHFLAADLDHGFVYCFVCEDYTYDHELDCIAARLKKNFFNVLGITEPLEDWYVSSDSEADISNWSIERKSLKENSHLGLRGLSNFGSTCFMNSILQVLMHAPLLRNYFLSNPHFCQPTKSTLKSIVCELSQLFQEFYSGKIEMLCPSQFLHTVWTHRDIFAKDEQFDAQEFLLSLLDLMNEHCAGKTDMCTYYSNGYSDIFRRIFSGLTQSDVVCISCKHVSTQKEFFWDTSLELGITGDSWTSATKYSLEQCLQRFTSEEFLDGDFACSNCNKTCKRYKQLSFYKLPYVITFHLKRFSGTSKKQKIDIHVPFPEVLDMSEFLCYSRSQKYTIEANAKRNSEPIKSDNRYYLFGVVVHKGTGLDLGHYIAYIRHYGSQWFECDDKHIKRATVSTVMESEAYLLFYHKELIEYE